MPIRLNEIDPLNTLGGKSQLIDRICNIVEYAIEEFDLVGVADYFMGGNRLFLHLDPDRELKLKLANEIDRGVVNFFHCLQNPYKTDKLIDEIWLLAEGYVSKDKFDEANELRLKEETPQILSAALTYIVAKYSRAADRQIFIETNASVGIPPHTLEKLYYLDEIIGDVEITCGDYKEQFYKYSHRSDIISWFDPPYIKTEKIKTGNRNNNRSKETKETHGYIHEFTKEDQKTLVNNLLATKNKVILSGYLNDIYEELEKENKFHRYFIGEVIVKSSGTGRKENEYIWSNFVIPFDLLPDQLFEMSE